MSFPWQHKQVQPNTKKVALGLALGIGLSLSLGACSSTPDEAPLQCPEVSILSDGADLVRFVPGANYNLANIVHEESIDGFKGECEHNIDDQMMSVEITPQFVSRKGVANTTSMARFEYFVAITDNKGALINKRRFPATITYPAGIEVMAWKDEAPITLSLPMKESDLPTKWHIFIGLQLNRGELEYIKNRAR